MARGTAEGATKETGMVMGQVWAPTEIAVLPVAPLTRNGAAHTVER